MSTQTRYDCITAREVSRQTRSGKNICNHYLDMVEEKTIVFEVIDAMTYSHEAWKDICDQYLDMVQQKTIVFKEIRRFSRIWVQTLVPPVITTVLYFIIFGNLLKLKKCM